MRSTRISRHINAPRSLVYRALLDAGAIAKWKVPDGMTSEVHEFEAREGGSIRVSLTYVENSGAGKTRSHTDTYHGRFVRLVTNERVVEVEEFETSDPALRGEMTITITLADADGGTDLFALHEGLPGACLLPTTKLVGTWHWQNSRRSSKRTTTAQPGYKLPFRRLPSANCRPDRIHEQCLGRRCGSDMQAYSDGKTEFIQDVERRAATWRQDKAGAS